MKMKITHCLMALAASGSIILVAAKSQPRNHPVDTKPVPPASASAVASAAPCGCGTATPTPTRVTAATRQELEAAVRLASKNQAVFARDKNGREFKVAQKSATFWGTQDWRPKPAQPGTSREPLHVAPLGLGQGAGPGGIQIKGPAGITPCTHSITFRDLDPAKSAARIRIVPVGGTSIAAATAPGTWTSTMSGGQVVFAPSSGLVPATTLVGFSLTVKPGSKYVFVIWETAAGQQICGQTLLVPCAGLQNGGAVADAARFDADPPSRTGKLIQLPQPIVPAKMRTTVSAPPSTPVVLTDPSIEQVTMEAGRPTFGGTQCMCLQAWTGADDYASSAADPDISVTVGNPQQTQVANTAIVPFSIVSDPVGLPFQYSWVVYDLDDNIVPVNPTAVSYNPATGIGSATFAFPGPGPYYINLFAGLNCPAFATATKDMDIDDFSDDDEAFYKCAVKSPDIDLQPTNPCNPLEYSFTDITKDDDGSGNMVSSPVSNSKWSVNGTVVTLTAGQYVFPTFGTYQVCLSGFDDSGTPSVTDDIPIKVCKSVTIKKSDPELDFEFNYNSCATQNFAGNFKNLSKATPCPGVWSWDFDGNGTSDSNLINPSHTYATSGAKQVTLKFTDQNGQVYTKVKTIQIQTWKPSLTFEQCNDGKVAFNIDWNGQSAGGQITWTIQSSTNWFVSAGSMSEEFVKLCWLTTDSGVAKVQARNSLGGMCVSDGKDFSVRTLMRCCPRSKYKKDVYTTNNEYRMRYIGKVRGHGPDTGIGIINYWPTAKRIVAKTILYKKKSNGKYRRKTAVGIYTSIDGQILKRGANSHCNCTNPENVNKEKERLSRKQVTVRAFPTGIIFRKFRVQLGAVLDYYDKNNSSYAPPTGQGYLHGTPRSVQGIVLKHMIWLPNDSKDSPTFSVSMLFMDSDCGCVE